MDIKTGTVVISSAGHDKGRFMLVVGVAEAESGRILVADGKERRLDKPKKKNIKHVRATRSTIDPTGLTDKKLRRTLRELSEKPRIAGKESEELV